ncbi:MAG: hypothetical protein CVU97_01930 [Firmicutes bacterium HGW-Firmicutes-21]|nr:MAG: hypothetical protein CVU97_01930 [Firmicutes bacterium HGW-Firmicutes-21]
MKDKSFKYGFVPWLQEVQPFAFYAKRHNSRSLTKGMVKVRKINLSNDKSFKYGFVPWLQEVQPFAFHAKRHNYRSLTKGMVKVRKINLSNQIANSSIKRVFKECAEMARSFILI